MARLSAPYSVTALQLEILGLGLYLENVDATATAGKKSKKLRNGCVSRFYNLEKEHQFNKRNYSGLETIKKIWFLIIGHT